MPGNIRVKCGVPEFAKFGALIGASWTATAVHFGWLMARRSVTSSAIYT